MYRSALKQYVESLKQLPTLPPVAVKLIEIAGKDNTNLQEIIQLIEVDPALSSKILFVSNSIHFNACRKVSTVGHAVNLMGINLIRTITLSLIVFRLFKDLPSGTKFDLVGFWHHCIATAIAAELLAQRFDYPQPQEAFTAGLLHDIGKLVLYQWNNTLYEQTLEDAQSESMRLLEKEEMVYGIGHTDIAYHLMTHWRFPEPLAMSVWLHHQPADQLDRRKGMRLPWIVKCANCLCNIQRFGCSGDLYAEDDTSRLAELSGLSSKEIDSLGREILNRFEEVSGWFDFKGTSLELYLSAVNQANNEISRLMTDMTENNHRLAQQCQVLDAIRRMTESLPNSITSSRALLTILELLSATARHHRILGFIPRPEAKALEGYMKVDFQSPWEKILLPIRCDLAIDYTRLSQRQQVSLVEKAVADLGNQVAVGVEVAAALAGMEISAALHEGKLIVLSMEANGCNQGQILLELADAVWDNRESIDLLRQFGRAAGLALQKILLQEANQQQADELVRTIRQIEEAKTKLIHMERLSSVGRLAAGAAHEINNPLTVISGRAQLLFSHAANESEKRSLRLIIEQSARIAKIIHDMMGLARPAEPKFESIAVEPIISHVVSLLSQRMKSTGILLQEEYTSDCPPVYADEKQMEQVFLNLMVNAIQAMNEGGVLGIAIRAEKGNKKIRIEISDTGVGIREEDLKSVFDPFFTTKKDGEGNGLGLAICQSIVLAHQGEIGVSSRLGQGSTFRIMLPATSCLLPQSVADKSNLYNLAWKQADHSLGSILVVDDEEDICHILEDALTLKGYRIETARDGVQGLEKVGRQYFDLMLLDLRMPKKAGLEVLKITRKTHPNLPIVIISGVAHESEFTEALKLGASACLKKPFDILELLSIIKSLLHPAESMKA